MSSQMTEEERGRCEGLTKEINETKKKYKTTYAKKEEMSKKMSLAEEELRTAEQELSSQEERARSCGETRRRLEVLVLELQEVEERRGREVAVLQRMVAREKELVVDVTKAAEQLEEDEARGVELRAEVERDVAARQAARETRVRLEATIARLVRKRDELGGVSPALVEKCRRVGRKELGRRLARLLQQARQAGSLNQKADDQLAQFEQEQAGLARRYQELEETKAKIEDMAAVLDNKKAEQILYTYRQLCRHFSAVFQELVPEGGAELLLTGAPGSAAEQEVLEQAAGLSTSVTFAGDAGPRRNMEELSGGQKTLVALAFILAIQRCDPAPFYLFDEVDAALDRDYRCCIGSNLEGASPHCPPKFVKFRSLRTLSPLPVQGRSGARHPPPGRHGAVRHHHLPARAARQVPAPAPAPVPVPAPALVQSVFVIY